MLKGDKDGNSKIFGLINSAPKEFIPLAITWAGLIKENDDDDPYQYRGKSLAFIFFNSDPTSLKNNESALIKLFLDRVKNKRNINVKELIMWSFLDNGSNGETIKNIALSMPSDLFKLRDGHGDQTLEIRIAVDLVLGNLGDEISANKIISILKDDRKEQSLPARIFLCSSALFVKNNNVLKHYSFLLDDETPSIPATPSGTNIYQRICDYSIIQLAKKFNIDPKEFLMVENKDRWHSLYIFQQDELKKAKQTINKKLNEIKKDNPGNKQPPKDK
jgi:putative component of toxin-antitoxin plasmid stabilization module